MSRTKNLYSFLNKVHKIIPRTNLLSTLSIMEFELIFDHEFMSEKRSDSWEMYDIILGFYNASDFGSPNPARLRLQGIDGRFRQTEVSESATTDPK